MQRTFARNASPTLRFLRFALADDEGVEEFEEEYELFPALISGSCERRKDMPSVLVVAAELTFNVLVDVG